jgi:SulP family sulfate permease
MVAGVTAGMVLASFLFAQHIAQMPRTELQATHTHPQAKAFKPNVALYHIQGALFFGTAAEAIRRTDVILLDTIDTLVIDMEHVSFMDMSGIIAIETLVLSIAKHHKQIVLCGQMPLLERIRDSLPTALKMQVSLYPSVEIAAKNL